jgi:hypothetical protein
MNKGRFYGSPGLGLAGDWPGGWTQTYAQIDTEAGAHGFDKDYFAQQVAGLSQIAGELMLVDPRVIDLGWGKLKSALMTLPDLGFTARDEGRVRREKLMQKYITAFRHVEASAFDRAKGALEDLAADVMASVATEQQGALKELVDGQLAKLA